MRKGEMTREGIIKEAARLFNTEGYGGGSLSKLMARTGLKKGGIYNHFASKEEITLEAFDYGVGEINRILAEVFRRGETATEKLLALFDFYRDFPLEPTIPGGCVILNTIVEMDDTDHALKARVADVLRAWQAGLARIIAKGQGRGEIRANVDSESAAAFILAAIEGGIAITRGRNDPRIMINVTNQLRGFVLENLST